MIVVRSPLRITLGGGGTDLNSFYKKEGGFLVSAAINKYIYISINRPFDYGFFLKYSKQEKANDIKSINHPIIREALNLIAPDISKLDITSLADIPSGTGLGSSSSFTTALIQGIYTYQNRIISKHQLADLACKIEIDILKEPIGKQDQFISSYGGITAFDFNRDDSVNVNSIAISHNFLNELEDNMLMFFTGFTRKAGDLLKDQNEKSKTNDKKMLDNLKDVKNIGIQSFDAIKNENLQKLAELFNVQWDLKRNRSSGMTNSDIDNIYYGALNSGALGGKLVGAGGGGFLLFIVNDKKRLREYMNANKLEEVRFNFDFEGTKVLL
jgi:D-glycero-alpha-D-manno-heptose-7-phosphate kinase